MSTWIYILIIVIYLIYQYQVARRKKQQHDEAQKKRNIPQSTRGNETMTSAKQEAEDRMKEIFRQMEMKTKPYARPASTQIPSKSRPETKKNIPASSPVQKTVPRPLNKKEPEPFLNVDMTQEEVLPEGTPSNMSTDAFEKEKISYDYNASAPVEKKHRIDLRQAMIATVIMNRPEW